MSDWIEKLHDEQEAKTTLEALEHDKQEQERLLIASKGPDLWRGLTSTIDEDVKKLDKVFSGKQSMNLHFERDMGDKIIVTNPAKHTGFSAQWIPEELIIKLIFTEQLLGVEGVPADRDQIRFLVSPSGEVVMMWGDISAPGKISEQLLKRLLVDGDAGTWA